jgi:predicted XRE-type DNA-binding protein
MATVGKGVQEIRVRDETGAFRVMYVAKFADAVYVLHCFQKKSQKTNQQGGFGYGRETLRRSSKGARPMSNETFASVWDAIEDTAAEAENMKLRSALMMALEQHIRAKGWTQTEAARRLGVTQPRVSDLLRGKINLFALDTLVNMVAAAGLHVEMRVLEAA